MELTRIKCG